MIDAVLKLPFCNKEFLLSGSEKDESILHPIKASGFYEVDIMNLLHRFIKPGVVCLDIGANIGAISLTLSYLAGKGKVYSFEPSKENFQALMKNIQQNGMRNIRPFKLALFNRNCELEFSYVEEFAGGSYLHIDGGARDPRARVEKVKCVRLDDFVKGANLKRVDFIKMDIEGAEINALEGARETISRFRPQMIIEFNPHCLKTFFNADAGELFSLIRGLYPNIFLLDGSPGALTWIGDYGHYLQITKDPSAIHNLYCSFEKKRIPFSDLRKRLSHLFRKIRS